MTSSSSSPPSPKRSRRRRPGVERRRDARGRDRLIRPWAGADERAFAGAVAAWAASVAPGIAAAEDAGALPPEALRGLADLGVLGLTVPEAHGGLGASAVVFALVLEELAAVWPSLAVAVSVSAGIVTESLLRHGTAAQHASWLPLLTRGDGLGSFALTESEAGSDAAALRTVAVEDGSGGWRLTGRKVFVTNARYAPLAIVLARVGPAEPGRPHAGITAFLVPVPSRGLRVERAERKMGLAASDTGPLVLDECRVGPDAVLGRSGRGFALAMEGLDGGRIGIAAQAVGIARGALERAVRYTKGRTQFGRPIAEFGAVRSALARARTELDAARLLTLRAAARKDRGLPFTADAAKAKLYASEMAQRVTHIALQLHGGYGYIRGYEVERYARDARATTLYEGTSEVQRLVIARAALA